MRMVIAGGSGFLGRRLTATWLEARHDVMVLTRNPDRASRVLPRAVTVRGWHPPSVDDDLVAALRGADAVVNLAGTPIGGRPWTPGHRRAILQSRIDATGALVEAMHRLPEADRPKVLVNASGIDIYGDRPEGELTEESPSGVSFLAGVVVAWEGAARAAEALGVRVVLARTALIVAPEALAWRFILLPFRLFVGGPLGSGRQRFTWIHVDDAVGLYDLAIRDDSVAGPLNMVAPEVPTQAELARAIGRAMHRPAILPVPAAILRLVLWGQADIVFHGRIAVAARALAAGYQFRHPTVDSALNDVLVTDDGRERSPTSPRARRIGHSNFINWLAGLVAGASSGLLILIFPMLAVLMVTIGVIGVLRSRPRVAGASGFFVGGGAILLVTLIRGLVACDIFDSQPSQGCEVPDATPWLVIGGGLLAAGLLLSAVAMARGSRRSPSGRGAGRP